LLQLAVRSYQLKVSTGSEGMIGEMGIAKTDIYAKGRVFVHGEWWNASSGSPIPSGAPIRVVGIEDLKLRVEQGSDVAKISQPAADTESRILRSP
jgi:membrane-bound serine protease (ClpP class)